MLSLSNKKSCIFKKEVNHLDRDLKLTITCQNSTQSEWILDSLHHFPYEQLN